MCKYLKTWGNERYLDAVEFAADLAPLLGGKVAMRPKDPDDYFPVTERGAIVLEDGLTVYVCTPWRDRASKWVFRSGADWRVTSKLTGHYRHVSFPEINVSAGKSLDQIAKDVKRRLIAPSAEPFAELQENLRDLQSTQDRIAAQVAAISKRFPWLKVKLEDGRTEAELYYNGDGSYFSGRLSASGQIYIDRVGSVDAGRAEAFLAVFAPRT